LVNGLRAPAEDVEDADAGDADRDVMATEVVVFLLDNKGADRSSSTSSMGVMGGGGVRGGGGSDKVAEGNGEGIPAEFGRRGRLER
jgi:hypothetical protein